MVLYKKTYTIEKWKLQYFGLIKRHYKICKEIPEGKMEGERARRKQFGCLLSTSKNNVPYCTIKWTSLYHPNGPHCTIQMDLIVPSKWTSLYHPNGPHCTIQMDWDTNTFYEIFRICGLCAFRSRRNKTRYTSFISFAKKIDNS